jgi:hypothetical protein
MQAVITSDELLAAVARGWTRGVEVMTKGFALIYVAAKTILLRMTLMYCAPFPCSDKSISHMNAE